MRTITVKEHLAAIQTAWDKNELAVQHGHIGSLEARTEAGKLCFCALGCALTEAECG